MSSDSVLLAGRAGYRRSLVVVNDQLWLSSLFRPGTISFVCTEPEGEESERLQRPGSQEVPGGSVISFQLLFTHAPLHAPPDLLTSSFFCCSAPLQACGQSDAQHSGSSRKSSRLQQRLLLRSYHGDTGQSCPSCTQDLLKHTPSSHPDHPLLQDALRISQNFLSSINEETAPRRQSAAARRGEVSPGSGPETGSGAGPTLG